MEPSFINDLAMEIYQNNKEKGFHEMIHEFGTYISLIHSELSEAVEAHRKKKRADMDMFSQALWMEKNPGQGEIFKNAFELYIKDTIEDELADAIIRLLDLSATLDIDIEEHIRLKIQYNKTREYKHGKLY